MQRIFRIAFLSLAFTAPSWAQSSAGPNLLVIAPFRDGPSSSSAAFVRRADFVAFDVTITSSETELANRVKTIAESRTLVTEALAKERVRFETGTTYLVLDQPVENKGPTFLPSNFASTASIGKYSRSNEVVVHVWVPLAQSGDTLLEASARVAAGLNSLKLPQRVALHYSPFRLAVENPERYRKELLAKIAEQVTMIKTAMRTAGKVSVSGLGSPVQVRQVNDTEIEISLPCSISAEVQ
jgi:hypothetical protein